jgi:hypothetical protein
MAERYASADDGARQGGLGIGTDRAGASAERNRRFQATDAHRSRAFSYCLRCPVVLCACLTGILLFQGKNSRDVL